MARTGTEKRICIRGLKAFEKSGCPESFACPAWAEFMMTPKDEPLKQKGMEGNCIDVWNMQFNFQALRLLEGNQQAIESFRNNMTGETGPKASQALNALVHMAGEAFKKHLIIQEHEKSKQIPGD